MNVAPTPAANEPINANTDPGFGAVTAVQAEAVIAAAAPAAVASQNLQVNERPWAHSGFLVRTTAHSVNHFDSERSLKGDPRSLNELVASGSGWRDRPRRQSQANDPRRGNRKRQPSGAAGRDRPRRQSQANDPSRATRKPQHEGRGGGIDRAGVSQANESQGGQCEAAAIKAAAPLPLLGSNQDSPDPESGVLPVTPRGTVVTWS